MKLEWEKIDSNLSAYVHRAKVFGGWLVMATEDAGTLTHDGYTLRTDQGHEWRSSLTFVPDPNHEWGAEQN